MPPVNRRNIAPIVAAPAKGPLSGRVGTYVTSWSNYNVNADQLVKPGTGIVYFAFLALASDGSVGYSDSYMDPIVLAGLAKLPKTTREYLILSIGGWGGSDNFSGVMASPSKVRQMLETAGGMMEKWNADGIDIDWEYPGNNDGTSHYSANDFANLTRFASDFKAAYPTKFLTMCLGASEDYSKLIADDFDGFNLMSYDYGGSWDSVVEPLSTAQDVSASIDAMLKWCPKEKLNVGFPLYGYQWKGGSALNQKATASSSETPLSSLPPKFFSENATGCISKALNQCYTYDVNSVFEVKLNLVQEAGYGCFFWANDEDRAGKASRVAQAIALLG